MVREEAIQKLKNFADHAYPNEEFLIAIKALEQEPKTEPCEDCISRQAVKELFQEGDMMGAYIFLGIDDLPSVTPKEPKADILDKIIAEIDKKISHYDHFSSSNTANGLTMAKEIVEKYRQEG